MVLTIAFVLVWPLYAAGDAVPGADEVPFELVDGYLIIVQGSLPGLDRRVNVLIDTGATTTFVSRKLASDVGLRNVPSNGIKATAFGSSVEVERVLLRELQLGPRLITRSCLAADLRWDGIDVVLGLDVLRETSLTIDYERSRLVFGAPSSLAPSAALEEEEGLLVVPVTMNGKTMRWPSIPELT